MPNSIVDPPLVSRGDHVAVISPSWAAPGFFPQIHEAAMQRLRDEYDLIPVEYPTTRRSASPQERARDIMAAFADPQISAVLSTIGGSDQITVLPHLNEEIIRANPKRFVGLSDNTNLLNYLYYQGISGVHGGGTQAQLGPVPDRIHLDSLRTALFGGDIELTAPARTRDVGIDWGDPAALTTPAPDLPAEPWTWSGPKRVVRGRTWGGCIEILQWTLGVSRYIGPVEQYAGCVLLLEASEELLSPTAIYESLRVLGERGLLSAASALLWGRPPAGDHHRPADAETAAAWRAAHRESVLKAVAEYAPDLVVVLDVDFGHTSPQWLLPYGGWVTVDAARQRITAHFG